MTHGNSHLAILCNNLEHNEHGLVAKVSHTHRSLLAQLQQPPELQAHPYPRGRALEIVRCSSLHDHLRVRSRQLGAQLVQRSPLRRHVLVVLLLHPNELLVRIVPFTRQRALAVLDCLERLLPSPDRLELLANGAAVARILGQRRREVAEQLR